MKIAICSSMAFAKEMLRIKRELEDRGHKVIIQDDVEAMKPVILNGNLDEIGK